MLFIKVISNIFKRLGAYLKSQYNLSILQLNNPNCKFYPGVVVSDTKFGNYNVVFDNCTIQSCIIDSHTYVQKRSTIFHCKIGKFCSIASHVSIAPGAHIITGVSTHPAFYLKDTPLIIKYADKDLFTPSKQVIIGHDVWIGERSIILDGVNIGTGAVIAAGSVVTKDVEPYAIVGGCPAKLIRYRFDQARRDALLLSEWWLKDEGWLSTNYSLFSDPDQLLSFISNDR